MKARKKETKTLDVIMLAVFAASIAVSVYWTIVLPYCLPDYSWVYIVCQNIKEGLMVYRDFSIVTTPLFYCLLSVPLHICDSYMTMKLTFSLMIGIYFIWLYYVMNRLKLHKGLRIIFFGFTCAYFMVFEGEINYNTLVQMLASGVVYCIYMIWKEGASLGRSTALALLIAAMILTKHTIGCIITVCVAIVLLFMCFTHRIKFRKLVPIIVIDVLCAAVFIIWLLANGALSGFFECTLGGLGSFSKTEFAPLKVIGAFAGSPLYMVALGISIIVLITAVRLHAGIEAWLVIFVAADFISVYPIPNEYHVNIMCLPLMLYLITAVNGLEPRIREKYMQKGTIEKRIKKLGKSARIINSLSAYVGAGAIFVTLCLLQIFMPVVFSTTVSLNGTKYYDGVSMYNDQYEKMRPMLEYMSEHPDQKFYSPEEVYSGIESIYGNNVDGKWNCFLKGNIGTDSPIDRINEAMKDSDSRIYIYRDDNDIFWQSFTEADEYVRENFTYVDSVGVFDVYCGKTYNP